MNKIPRERMLRAALPFALLCTLSLAVAGCAEAPTASEGSAAESTPIEVTPVAPVPPVVSGGETAAPAETPAPTPPAAEAAMEKPAAAPAEATEAPKPAAAEAPTAKPEAAEAPMEKPAAAPAEPAKAAAAPAESVAKGEPVLAMQTAANFVGYTGEPWVRDFGTVHGRCDVAAAGDALGSATSSRNVALFITAGAGEKLTGGMDERDHACFGQSLELLRKGHSAAWKNDETGLSYRVTAGRDYSQGQRACREFVVAVSGAGRKDHIKGGACREADGKWAYDTGGR